MAQKLSLKERAKLLTSLLSGGRILAENGGLAYQKDNGVAYDLPRSGNSVDLESIIRSRKVRPLQKGSSNIKILYAVRKMPDLPNSKKKKPRTEDERWFCVGGWTVNGKDIVVKKLPWETQVWHVSIDNLPGDDFAVNLCYDGKVDGSERIYEYIRPVSGKGWKYTASKDVKLDNAVAPASPPAQPDPRSFSIQIVNATFEAPTLTGYFGERSLESGFFIKSDDDDTMDELGSQKSVIEVGKVEPNLNLLWILSPWANGKISSIKSPVVGAKTPKKGTKETPYTNLRKNSSPSWADTYFRCKGHGCWYIGMQNAAESKKDLYETPDFKPASEPPVIPVPPVFSAYYIEAIISVPGYEGTYAPLPSDIRVNINARNIAGSSYTVGTYPEFLAHPEWGAIGYNIGQGFALASRFGVYSTTDPTGLTLTQALNTGHSLLYWTNSWFQIVLPGQTEALNQQIFLVTSYKYVSRYIPAPSDSVYAGYALNVVDAVGGAGGFPDETITAAQAASWGSSFLGPRLTNRRCTSDGQPYLLSDPDPPPPWKPPKGPSPGIVGGDTIRTVEVAQIWSDNQGSSEVSPVVAKVEENIHLYNGQDKKRSSPDPNPVKTVVSDGKPMFLKLGGPQRTSYKKSLLKVDKGEGEITNLLRVDRRRGVGICFYTDLSKKATCLANPGRGVDPEGDLGMGTPRMGWTNTRSPDSQVPGEQSEWDLENRVQKAENEDKVNAVIYDYGMFTSYRYCPISEEGGFARIDLGHPRLTLDAAQVLEAYQVSEDVKKEKRVRESPFGPINSPAYLYTKKAAGVRSKNIVVTVEIYKNRFKHLPPKKKKVIVYKLTEAPFIHGKCDVDTGDPRTWDFYCHDISYI